MQTWKESWPAFRCHRSCLSLPLHIQIHQDALLAVPLKSGHNLPFCALPWGLAAIPCLDCHWLPNGCPLAPHVSQSVLGAAARAVLGGQIPPLLKTLSWLPTSLGTEETLAGASTPPTSSAFPTHRASLQHLQTPPPRSSIRLLHLLFLPESPVTRTAWRTCLKSLLRLPLLGASCPAYIN